MKRFAIYIFMIFFSILFISSVAISAWVIEREGKTYIRDRTGEFWDVTQAKELGFKPDLFQYGIGKNAFRPLDDSYLIDGSDSNIRNQRVIGVADDSEAKAYSVPKLRYHEIANSRIGEEQIVVGY